MLHRCDDGAHASLRSACCFDSTNRARVNAFEAYTFPGFEKKREKESVCSGRTKSETILFIYIYNHRRGFHFEQNVYQHQTIEFRFFFFTRTNGRRKAFNSVSLLYRDFIVRQSAPNLMFSDSLIHFHRYQNCTRQRERERLEATADNREKKITNKIRRVEHYLIMAQFLVSELAEWGRKTVLGRHAKSKY